MLKKDNKEYSVKSDNGNNLIKITDFYAHNCTEQEYVEVNDEVLEFLVQKKREEKKLEMRDYRHLAPFGFDEIETAEMHSIYEKSAEDSYFAELQSMELYEAMGKLKLVFRRRFYLYHVDGLTMEEIAKMEGVSRIAISKSLKKTAEELRRLLCNSDEE